MMWKGCRYVDSRDRSLHLAIGYTLASEDILCRDTNYKASPADMTRQPAFFNFSTSFSAVLAAHYPQKKKARYDDCTVSPDGLFNSWTFHWSCGTWSNCGPFHSFILSRLQRTLPQLKGVLKLQTDPLRSCESAWHSSVFESLHWVPVFLFASIEGVSSWRLPFPFPSFY